MICNHWCFSKHQCIQDIKLDLISIVTTVVYNFLCRFCIRQRSSVDQRLENIHSELQNERKLLQKNQDQVGHLSSQLQQVINAGVLNQVIISYIIQVYQKVGNR